MSAVLDVAIGLGFMYLLLALVVSTVQEFIATLAEWRAKELYSAIVSMLEGDSKGKEPLVQQVFAHPLIKNLRKDPKGEGAKGGPSYIPSRTFAAALLDVLQGKKLSEATRASNVLEGAQQIVSDIAVPEIRESLQALVWSARVKAHQLDTDVAVVTTAIETWFNDRMARASGWYKRKARCVGMILSGLVVTLANADSIEIGRALWRDPALREAIVAQAAAYHEANASDRKAIPPEANTGSTSPRPDDDPITQLEKFSIPLGWNEWPQQLGYLTKGLGLLLSALAVSLGGDFWFNLLGRFLQLRSTGPRVSPKTGKSGA